MRTGTIGLIALAVMLVMAPGAAAYAVDVVGTIQYENGAPCPYGWLVLMDNLNETYVAEPWDDYSHSFIFWDYKVTGESESDDHCVTVNVTSPDGRWFDERACVKLGDVYNTTTDNYDINLVVHEVTPETETFTKELTLGWNLISLPLTPTNSSTGAVLGNDTIAYNAVYRYNATSKQFECPSTMDPGIGYFVDVTAAGIWEYEGTPVSSTSPGLKSGLNMIGVPNCTMSVSDAMGHATDYRYVASWNADDQKYEVYNPSAPEAFQHFDMMAAGEGYFISAGSDDAEFAISCLS